MIVVIDTTVILMDEIGTGVCGELIKTKSFDFIEFLN